VVELTTPLKERDIRNLKVGDKVELSGKVFTLRDRAHKHILGGGDGPDFENQVIFHCGPIVEKVGREWKVVSAGPTTSTRMEYYEPEFIDKYNIRGIIGKGGMGEKTLAALKEFGCVYFSAIGGAAAVIADSVEKVDDVHKLDEFGMAEAIWELKVDKLPLVVTMDANGNSLHKEVLKESQEKLKQLL
jgi:fumarate hydratase class I